MSVASPSPGPTHCSESHDCCSHGPLLGASLAGTRLQNAECVMLETGCWSLDGVGYLVN